MKYGCLLNVFDYFSMMSAFLILEIDPFIHFSMKYPLACLAPGGKPDLKALKQKLKEKVMGKKPVVDAMVTIPLEFDEANVA